MGKIETRIIKINNDVPEKDSIALAAEIIKKGGIVAFPTETVYGLGANALDVEAVDNIFKAKGRPQDNPLIVHIAHMDQLEQLVTDIPEVAYNLMERFWPGPLTIIFNRSSIIPDMITGGLDTVAIRMPDHKIALELIREANLPIAAPSANISGKPSPTDAAHVIEDMMGKIEAIIDGGPTGIGVESTVLDISTEVPTILRPGGITLEDLLEVFPKVNIDPFLQGDKKDIAPKSPGQKYRHYSPKAEMVVVEGQLDDITQKINQLAREYEANGRTVGIMATAQTKDKYHIGEVLVVGDRNDLITISGNLFKTLREFDKLDVEIILAEGIKEEGLGRAIMNRMRKAAGSGSSQGTGDR